MDRLQPKTEAVNQLITMWAVVNQKYKNVVQINVYSINIKIPVQEVEYIKRTSDEVSEFDLKMSVYSSQKSANSAQIPSQFQFRRQTRDSARIAEFSEPEPNYVRTSLVAAVSVPHTCWISRVDCNIDISIWFVCVSEQFAWGEETKSSSTHFRRHRSFLREGQLNTFKARES